MYVCMVLCVLPVIILHTDSTQTPSPRPPKQQKRTNQVGDDASAHARLEQQLITALESIPESEALAAAAAAAGVGEEGWDERQRAALRPLLEGGEGDDAKAYALALLSEFSWEEGAGEGGEGAEAATRALATLLQDAHGAAALRGKVDVTAVVAALGAAASGSDFNKEKESSSLLFQRALALASASDSAVNHNEEAAAAALHASERGYQATVRQRLHELHTQRRMALTAALGSAPVAGGERDGRLLRSYLLLLAESANVEAFDRWNQGVLGGVLPGLRRVFRGKPETVAAAYGVVVEQVYGGEEMGGSGGLRALAGLAGRTEAWVEATLLKLMEAAFDHGGEGAVLPNPILLTANWLSQDCYAAGVRSPGALRRLRGEMAAAVAGAGGVVFEGEEGEGMMDREEAAMVLQEALALPIGAHAEGGVETYEALMEEEGQGPVEGRARAAKALLEYLRQHDAYHAYTGAVKDTVVSEIEEELRDTIYECSDDLGLDLDPNLVDLKPREHYDVPSLRFRVLNDAEAAASLGVRDGFVEEEGGLGKGGGAWRPHDVIHDPSAAAAADANAGALPQRRWSFAFKDSALGGEKQKAVKGKEGGATVVRDARTGRLRAATGGEEGKRSWRKRKEGLPLKEWA